MNHVSQRIRLKYAKTGDLRFTGHLDLQRLFERALRRSQLPLKYSQGFSPKVRINLAGALPLGFTSDCELLDFWLSTPLPVDEIWKSLSQAIPEDIIVKELYEVNAQLPSLQASLRASEYRISLPAGLMKETILADFQNILRKETLPYERRKKTVDIKPMLLGWQLTYPILTMRLSNTESMNGRPDEWLDLLGIDPALCEIQRSHLIFEEA